MESSEPIAPRPAYDRQMAEIRAAFDLAMRRPDAGRKAIAARSAAVDILLQAVWQDFQLPGIALVAVGGYGRRELFPFSDVDLLFLLDPKLPEASAKDPIRRLNQTLWDCGLRLASMTRTLAECERFDPENVEFTLALFDARHLAGDPALTARLCEKSIPRVIARDRKKILSRLLDVTRTRHARYGGTLFHLEPNIKECPGGLRDANVTAWLQRLGDGPALPEDAADFEDSRQFLILVRAFLHFRHQRDDNTLDWTSQDEAAAVPLGALQASVDPAYWMRLYFRHARAIERHTAQLIEEATPAKSPRGLLAAFRAATPQPDGFKVEANRIAFTNPKAAQEPDTALAIFATIARTGASLSREAEISLEDAIPQLSQNLEDGLSLWRQLEPILTGPFAGRALRAMHTLGVLELLIPEFHGIDALVIRDAYHRYTVDEHTFVLIDTLHALTSSRDTRLREPSFADILRDLPHPSLLYLAALLHDTGKGRAGSTHAIESTRMAESVVRRLELDPYEAGMVLDLIRNHLEMSAALRRDVFDSETVGSFAARVQTPEALRMLTLFTFADIRAVHPGALTPWKAENLWNLHMATANFLDRNVDDERVAGGLETQLQEIVHTIQARRKSPGGELAHITSFLEGLPRRYLQTRDTDRIRAHVDMAQRLATDSTQLDFHFGVPTSELTLVTRDRPMLFAAMAGSLAGWGMNIVTADAFSNAHGIVVDSFRFTDTFRTLELNESERERFLKSIHDVISAVIPVEALLAARRRGRRKPPKVHVATRIDFDSTASSHSTLLQVVAQDTPGLLRVLSLVIAQHECEIQVALIDTEGETAIDVFYLTHHGHKLDPQQQLQLRQTLLEGIESNAR